MKKKEPAPVYQELEKPETELEFKVRVYLGETRQRVQEKVKKKAKADAVEQILKIIGFRPVRVVIVIRNNGLIGWLIN